MEREQLLHKINTHFPQFEAHIGNQFVEVIAKTEELTFVAEHLKMHNELLFDFLVCVTGVDYGDCLGVVYHLRSTKLHHNIVLKVKCLPTVPTLDSLRKVWITAHYNEREIFDLLGITFNNHPDMRRLFLDDDFVGSPLRKDFDLSSTNIETV